MYTKKESTVIFVAMYLKKWPYVNLKIQRFPTMNGPNIGKIF
jgi:hypothetical protein